MVAVFFCFKQKTAYEMRISDWSSDVCSSDLMVLQHFVRRRCRAKSAHCPFSRPCIFNSYRNSSSRCDPTRNSMSAIRSEQHTSELQSLMRISYAVFCLKKKTTIQRTEPQYCEARQQSRTITPQRSRTNSTPKSTTSPQPNHAK